MQRISQLENTSGKARVLLDNVNKNLGSTPNFFTTLAQAPAALEAYLGFNAALSKGKLAPQLREQLALTVAGFNGCGYCASAHSFLGSKAGIDATELRENRAGRSADGETQAALNFANALLEKRGSVSDRDLAAVRDAGYDDEQVIEILAHVALNTFSNYFNETAGTQIDFPIVTPEPAGKVA